MIKCNPISHRHVCESKPIAKLSNVTHSVKKVKTIMDLQHKPITKSNSVTKCRRKNESEQQTTTDLRIELEALEFARAQLGKSLDSRQPNGRSWLINSIMNISSLTPGRLRKQPFKFTSSVDAMQHNSTMLKKFDYNYPRLAEHYQGSILSPGSEFRSQSIIAILLQHHQDWSLAKSIVIQGVKYPLDTTSVRSESTRKKDLTAMIERGNHKSSMRHANKQSLVKAYQKEVEYGWLIPISIDCLEKLEGASVIPLGVAEQNSITAFGERIPKARVTHDLSFLIPSGFSINDRTKLELLPECRYGFCFRRIIHQIHRLRLDFPTIQIFLLKLDLDAAYRRLHVWLRHAILAMTVVDGKAFLETRLPFGAAAGPSLYSVISECIFDATNDLLSDETWTPDDLSAPKHLKFDKPVVDDTQSGFDVALPLQVPIPSRQVGCDGYIDDIITYALGLGDNVTKA